MTMARKLTLLLALASACAHAPAEKPAEVAGKPGRANRPQLAGVPPAVLYKESRELMARGRWDEARERVEAYLLHEPRSAPALFDAGFLAEERGDEKAAADDYRRALQSEPAHLGAALNLARLLPQTPGEAEQVLRATIARRVPPEPALLDALAAVLRAQGKLDEARAVVQQVLQRHPRDAAAHRNLAAIEAGRGHLRLAESALNNARKLDDKDAGILNSLGLLAMRREDAAAARAFFAQATQLDPDFAPAWANLGALALSYRDYAAAEQAYARAVQLDPARFSTRLAHGWALEGLRRPKDARAEYEKVLALEPGQEDALYGRALALKAEGDLPAALRAFKEYLANSRATQVKEAQGQIASIDMRLANQPAALPKAATAQKGAGLDLSKLPQGSDPGSFNEKLPAEEGTGSTAAR